MNLPIYMDYHSTTPVDPKVFKLMEPYFSRDFGNAASKSHLFGMRAKAAVDKARRQVADSIGAEEQEIYFTSGATESNNMAILGVAEALREKGDHVITAATEHKAVLDPCKHLEDKGFQVTYLPVDPGGFVDPEALKRALTPKTILVSIMTANNEIGTLQPMDTIGKITKEAGVFFHSDAAQALGKIPFDVNSLGVDLVSMTAHKIYGPKGIGALYVREQTAKNKIHPILFGGGHERGLRSGTLDVPAVVGLGEALALAGELMKEESRRVGDLRDQLRRLLMEGLEEVYLNGAEENRLPNNLNLSFAYVKSDNLMMEMRDVAVSSGSACTSASSKPSHVLRALGIGEARTLSSIRFGLGRFTTQEEVEHVAKRTIEAVKKLRGQSVEYQMSREGVEVKASR